MAETGNNTLPSVVREFRPNCPGCTPMTVTDAERRPCSFYDCPGLSEELKVTCDLCMFDFAAGSGQVESDPEPDDARGRLAFSDR